MKKSKHLVIDARMYGTKHGGIGRYVEELISHLPQKLPDFRTTLICHPDDATQIDKLTPANWRPVPILAAHYSLAEQTRLAKLLAQLQPDLVHFPHFNIPVLFRGKFIVTIHDILWHKQKGSQVTTLPAWAYWPKYLAYRLVMRRAVLGSTAIITPSNYVKTDIIHTYLTQADKIVHIPEGVAEIYLRSSASTKKPPLASLRKPYFIYTGSFYPHKNIKRLITAVKGINKSGLKVNLYLAGSRSVFTERIFAHIKKIKADQIVSFLGFTPDNDLITYYQNAVAFVFPSLSEGFGLPGLEALAAGCPVVAANSTSLPEIYGPHATYFKPSSTDSLTKALREQLVHPPSLKTRSVFKAYARQYTWQKTAELTANLYQQSIS